MTKISIKGRDLEITPADFESAMELQDAMSEALAEEKITFDMKSLEKTKEDGEGGDMGDLISAFLRLGKSKRLRNALFSCCGRALYGKIQVDRDFFEDEKNRPLYYPIMIEVLKVNVGPFIGGLFGLFQGLDLGGIVNNLKSK